MANQAGKLRSAQAAYRAAGDKGPGAQPGAGPQVSADKDSELQNKWHDRSYNPADSAERGSISSKLNEDSARYLKGPGPV